MFKSIPDVQNPDVHFLFVLRHNRNFHFIVNEEKTLFSFSFFFQFMVLKNACFVYSHRDAGVEVGECDVPSQPMLEWLCLKLLGASSLLARTLDRCSQAFMYPKFSHS